MTTTSRSTRCKISWPAQYFGGQLVPSRGRLWVFPCHMPSGIVACCAEVCRSPSILTSQWYSCCLSLLEDDPLVMPTLLTWREVGRCPPNIAIGVQASKLVASGTFGAICSSFACCCCYLSPRCVHTADQQIEKSNLVDFAFRIVLLHPSPGFEYFIEHVNKISQNHFLCPFQCSNFCGKYGSCIRQCIFWQVHDGRKWAHLTFVIFIGPKLFC